MSMNPEIKAEWTKALRSGEYAQCRKTLFNGEGYCCLGVLVDVLGKKFPEKLNGITVEKTDFMKVEHNLHTSTMLLPTELMIRIGMRYQKNVAKMNDHGNSFEEIANYIDFVEAHI